MTDTFTLNGTPIDIPTALLMMDGETREAIELALYLPCGIQAELDWYVKSRPDKFKPVKVNSSED